MRWRSCARVTSARGQRRIGASGSSQPRPLACRYRTAIARKPASVDFAITRIDAWGRGALRKRVDRRGPECPLWISGLGGDEGWRIGKLTPTVLGRISAGTDYLYAANGQVGSLDYRSTTAGVALFHAVSKTNKRSARSLDSLLHDACLPLIGVDVERIAHLLFDRCVRCGVSLRMIFQPLFGA
jgi:hypothetical protein